MNLITVDDALVKGQNYVNTPATIILFVFSSIGIYLNVKFDNSGWYVPLILLFSFTLSYLYWAIAVVKWKVWAFGRVRNKQELKSRAVVEKIIWNDDRFLSKTELWSKKDKELWETIKNDFKNKDVFIDDFSIPDETLIYYSKSNIIELLLLTIMIFYGIYALTIEHNYFIGSILTITGLYFGHKIVQKLKSKIPQIIINSKGIETISTQFYEWGKIHKEDVLRDGVGEDIENYLYYEHPKGEEKLKIDDLHIIPRHLKTLLVLYRGRYKQKTTNR